MRNYVRKTSIRYPPRRGIVKEHTANIVGLWDLGFSLKQISLELGNETGWEPGLSTLSTLLRANGRRSHKPRRSS